MTPIQYIEARPLPLPPGLTPHLCADDGDLIDEQTCTNCKQMKPVSAFYFKNSTGSYYTTCKSCSHGARRKTENHQ